MAVWPPEVAKIATEPSLVPHTTIFVTDSTTGHGHCTHWLFQKQLIGGMTEMAGGMSFRCQWWRHGLVFLVMMHNVGLLSHYRLVRVGSRRSWVVCTVRWTVCCIVSSRLTWLWAQSNSVLKSLKPTLSWVMPVWVLSRTPDIASVSVCRLFLLRVIHGHSSLTATCVLHFITVALLMIITLITSYV